ncbi:M23 family metallopeptidase [Candidatus Woesearchaeota archaeon]|nr:M23 family metallopeptidase [Candidatus Woesearchaeota archaeon]
MQKRYLLVFLIVLLVGCAKEPVMLEDTFEEELQTPPTIYSIGINVDDVVMHDFHWTDKIFHEYGDSYEVGGISPHPEFYLPVGSKVYAVSNGVVESVPKLYSDDYSVLINHGSWTINYEHVLNPQVSKGDTVVVGDVIGEVSPLTAPDEGFGKWGLMIFKSSALAEDILSVCPYALLDESVKDVELQKIQKIVSDYETFMNDESIHDEQRWVSVGCYYDSFTEAQAASGKVNIETEDSDLH